MEWDGKKWWRDYPYVPEHLYKVFDVFGMYFIYSWLDDFWLDHVAWRIDHHIAGHRCENCPNWHERKTKSKDRWGWCDLHSPIAIIPRKDGTWFVAPTIHEHWHSWCPAYGVCIKEEIDC